MVTVYVCSPTPGAGKTALSIGLAQRSAADGVAVAYQKPVGVAAPGTASAPADPDAVFARQALRLRLPLETLAPIDLSHPPADARAARRRLQSAHAAASEGRDVVVLDGAADLRSGAELGLSGPEIARLLDARPLVVAAYAPERLAASLLETAAAFAGPALGAVVTAVPELGWRYVERELRPALAAAGLPLLGALPLARELLGTTFGDLAAALGGDCLGAADQTDRPVEACMIATVSDQNTAAYFRRRARKAVVAGGDRNDALLAALESDTSCVVVTGGQTPQAAVLDLARDLGVPLIKVAADTPTTLERISEHLATVRFRQGGKLPVLGALLAKHFDYPALRRGLGLRQEAAT